ncbi:MAG: hypothetical protein ACOC29_01450, partial [Candidatus Sumerlaeota bacterium]
LRYGEILEQSLGGMVTVVGHRNINLAEAVGRIGAKMIQAGETADPAELEPNYVRRPDARKPALPGFLLG